MQQAKREHLRALIEEKCLLIGGPYTLSTGALSSFYFDCKRATLSGECISLIADAFLEEINQLPSCPTAIGGLTMGADFITTAVTLRAIETGHSTVQGSIVRKERKAHGTQSLIENELPKNTKIVVVDDVITTGGSTATAGEQFKQAGYEIVGIIALIDREAGGIENLHKFGVPVRAIYKKSDFPRLIAEENRNAGINERIAAKA